jgi:hypothetical protein
VLTYHDGLLLFGLVQHQQHSLYADLKREMIDICVAAKPAMDDSLVCGCNFAA